MKISEAYTHLVARSHDTQEYEDGPVPFVTSAETDNGVVKYVKPLDGDRVVEGPCIVISGLGFATLHAGRVLPKGNGGDSCTILKAKTKASMAEYLSFAAVFNLLHKWRFSYGRKCGWSRIAELEVPDELPSVATVWKSQQDRLGTCLGDVSSTLFEEFEPAASTVTASDESETEVEPEEMDTDESQVPVPDLG
ncbi:MAG: hypothetical protein JST11_26615 [Acidobacteria bacterium]|nr:hypothetical protein [Acidobacteriota bacterium]